MLFSLQLVRNVMKVTDIVLCSKKYYVCADIYKLADILKDTPI